MISFIAKISNWKFILPTFLVYLFFAAYLLPSYEATFAEIAGEKLTVLDLRLQYTADDVSELFGKMQAEGREIYRHIARFIDVVYPLTYGVLFMLLIASLLKRLYAPEANIMYLSLLPFIIVLFDFIENFYILKLLDSFPEISATVVGIAATFTLLKWVFFGSAVGILVVAGIGWLKRRLTAG